MISEIIKVEVPVISQYIMMGYALGTNCGAFITERIRRYKPKYSTVQSLFEYAKVAQRTHA